MSEDVKESTNGKQPPPGRWTRSVLLKVGALGSIALTALVVFLVNYFAPGALKAVHHRGPLEATALVDDSWYAPGWTLALNSVPSSLPSLPPIQGCAGPQLKWTQSQGGIDVYQTTIKLVVENTQDSPVSITDIRPVVVSRSAPMDSTWVNCPSAGVNMTTLLQLNLDDAHPVARSTHAGFVDTVPFFQKHSVSLAPGEQHVFEIEALAGRGYYVWTLALDTFSNGEKRTMNPGTTFHTTAVATEYQAAYVWDWAAKVPHFARVSTSCATSAQPSGNCHN